MPKRVRLPRPPKPTPTIKKAPVRRTPDPDQVAAQAVRAAEARAQRIRRELEDG